MAVDIRVASRAARIRRDQGRRRSEKAALYANRNYMGLCTEELRSNSLTTVRTGQGTPPRLAEKLRK